MEIKANLREERANAVLDVFKEKLIKRQVSAQGPGRGRAQALPARSTKLHVEFKEGISQDDARKISKIIRDEGPKGVADPGPGDEFQGLHPKEAEQQEVQALLKGKDLDVALQFVNYR